MFQKRDPLLAVFFLFLCLSGQAIAEQKEAESQFFEEFPVVITATRLKQPLSETPSAMTVIDHAMIKASGSRTIPEILRLVPGMYVGYATGNTPIVSYHGAPEQYARRMQVLVDGRSIYMQPFVGITWSDIPIEIADIERIEVVRGPAAASYGANSLQGVINIITKDTAYTHNRVSTNQGDGGINDFSARLVQQLENLSYRLTVAHHEDQGFDFSPMNDGSRSTQLNLKGNYQINPQDFLDIQLGYSDGINSHGFLKRPDPYRQTLSISDFQQIEWHHSTSTDNELKISYHHTARSYQDSSQPINKDNFQVHRHELGFQHISGLNEDNRLVWGGNLRYESAATTILFQPAKSLQNTQLFMNDEWHLNPSLVLNGGAMLEDDGWGNRRGSPRVALNYHVTSSQTLRVGTSVAYRTPSMMEYGAKSSYIFNNPVNANNNLIGNPALKPEKVVSREIGWLGEFRELGLSLDARIYEDRITDFIFLNPMVRTFRPPEVAWSFANLYAVKYQGIESTLKYQWSDAGGGHDKLQSSAGELHSNRAVN